MGEAETTNAVRPVSMRDYTADTFTPLVGEMFRFDPTDGGTDQIEPAMLELLEVVQRQAAVEGWRRSFLLLFVLRSQTPLGPGLHRIVREGFEPGDWFLNRVVVPGRDPRVAYYQAVFG